MNKTMMAALLAASLLVATGAAQAGESDGIKFSGSGFLTVAAGRIFNGTSNSIDDARGYKGAGYVADYANDGVYEQGKGWMLGPDSKLGLQGSARFNDRFTITGQAVSRGARD